MTAEGNPVPSLKEYEISVGPNEKITVKGTSADIDNIYGMLIIKNGDDIVFRAATGKWNHYKVRA